MNELNLVVKSNAGSIEFNNEEIKTELAAQMQIYKELEVTEDGKKDIKKDIATLRKIRTAIEDKRKSIKKECMIPYDEFEKKVKELTGLIDEPIKVLTDKVQVFDDAVREEKKQLIIDIFNKQMKDCEVSEYLKLEKIRKPEWENVSYSKKNIISDISESIQSVKSGIETIKSFHSECEGKAIEKFLQNYDVAPAVTYLNEYERTKKEILERKAEEERIKAEEQKMEEASTAEIAPAQLEEPEEPFEEVEEIEEEPVTATYVLTGLVENLFVLESQMAALNITFERR